MASTLSRGICCIAIGDRALAAFMDFRDTLPESQQYLVKAISNESHQRSATQQSRYLKCTLPLWSPFDYTLYCDVDTFVHSPDIERYFDILEDGFDLVVCPCEHQSPDQFLWHIGQPERNEVLEQWGMQPLQLQFGVFAFRKSLGVHYFFGLLYGYWSQYQDQDQGALLRAIHDAPLKIWLMGKPFNDGAVISHRWGLLR